MSDETNKVEDDVGSNEGTLKSRGGRNRFCKKCKFSCTDSKEFLIHQHNAHSQDGDPDLIASLGGRRKSANSSNITLKKQFTRSNSTPDLHIEEKVSNEKSDMINGDIMETNDSTVDEVMTSEEKDLTTAKTDIILNNDQNSSMNNELDEQDDEGRLIIAEEELSKGKQPTRSGNIQNRTYVCSQCEFSSTSAKIFLHHQKEVHGLDIIIYECDICEYATKYKQKLPRHRKLHFTGKDSLLLSGSDLDNSFNERDREGSFVEFPKEKEFFKDKDMMVVHPDDDDDDEGEEEEEEEEVVPVVEGNPEQPVVAEKKKRKTRQEVDPAKYFEVMDDTGIKYACSKCGNVYKWRKSLNKHWKEKHFGEMADITQPPPGLAKLNALSHVKYRLPGSGMYTDGTRAPSLSPSSHGGHSGTNTPVNHQSYLSQDQDDSSNVVMPRFVGPFITNTTVYPSNAPQGKRINQSPLQAHSVTDKSEHLSRLQRMTPSNLDSPIDFSVKKDIDINQNTTSYNQNISMQIKHEPSWEGQTGDALTKEQMMANMEKGKIIENPILQCSRCGFVAKTLVDYSSHMTLHLNKRAFKCAECQEHFNGIEDLNKHFGENHSEKIHEHKEAIQKIPHGLQQTYHLLKMPLNSISTVSAQDVAASEPKYLKCSMCSFVAKWPAELQKHAVSHSEERPFVCMVCGSTYKWKWDLVKHFEKSHNTLLNPYKRREAGASIAKTSPPSTNESPAKPTTSPNQNINEYYGIPITPQTISSTTAALVDKGTLSRKTMMDEEPAKKKRRLSDTDMQVKENLEAIKFGESFGRENYITAGAIDLETPTRPASLPASTTANGESMDGYDNENDSFSSLKITNVSTLRDIENLIPPSDHVHQDGENRHVNEETQRAVMNAVKKRLESGQILQGSPNNESVDGKGNACSDILLPYKCSICEYRARWPSEITQHMKNHSDEKPYCCPRCTYKSKWKWDVVKHLKRCGGGTIKDVIDMTKVKRTPPPNVTVMPQGLFQQTPQPSGYMSNQYNSQNDNNSMMDDMNSSSNGGFNDMDNNSSDYEGFGKDYENDGMQQSLNEHGDGSNSRQTVFRSLINQGMYHCLECPFVGHSPAELRRHAVLHSENKPFTCRVCGYSSRWKCDLKKHMRTYGHYDSSSGQTDQMDMPSQPAFMYEKFRLNKMDANDQLDQDPDRPPLYKCDKCQYASYKKISLEMHMKIHGENNKEPVANAKFKCKQCEFQAQDLSSFLQHKKMHSQSVTPPGEMVVEPEQPPEHVSSRTLHLKHRRKPVQQFNCAKCPYTCFKRSGLQLHEAMHEPRGSEAFVCLYCTYNVYSKSLLIQHMKLHPEFDPSEFPDIKPGESDMMDYENETMQDEEEEEEDFDQLNDVVDMTEIRMREQSMEGRTSQNQDKNNELKMMNQREGMDFSSGALDLTRPASASTVSSQSDPRAVTPQPASIFGRNNGVPSGKFKCEWCDASFPNISTVYQHSKIAHPLELRAQETGEVPQVEKFSSIEDQLRQKSILQEKMLYQHQMQQQKLQQQMHEHQKRQNQQHPPSQYSQFNISSAFGQQPRYRPIEPKPSMSYPVSATTSSAPSSSHASPVPPLSVPRLQKPQDGNINLLKNTSALTQLAQQNLLQKAKKSTSPHKRGRSFQCTKCSFTAPNAVTYLRHIERHGSNCRHTCRFCDYSIDRLNLLYQHMKGTHGDLWRGTPEEKINLTSNTKDSSDRRSSSSMEYAKEFEMSGYLADLAREAGNGIDGKVSGEESLNSSSSSDYKDLISMATKNMTGEMREESLWKGFPIQACNINGRKHYRCTKCSYVSSNAANTTNHIRQHGSNRKYKCDKCDYSVDNLKLIYHHMESVHTRQSAQNEKVQAQLTSDMNHEENNNWDNSTKYSNLPACTRCPYRCKTIERLQQHLQMHEYNGKYKCEYCGFSVDEQMSLIKHLQVHREPYEPDLEETEKKNGTKTNENSNKPTMENNGEFNKQAPRLTKDTVDSIMIKAATSNKIRYRCSACPYKTLFKNNILKHRKQHVNPSQYKCTHCSYSANRVTLLEQHLRFHKQNLNDQHSENLQEIVLDPFDEGVHEVLNSTPIPSDQMEGLENEDRDFADDFGDNEFMDEDENMDEFDEEEMEALERAECERLEKSNEDSNELENSVENTTPREQGNNTPSNMADLNKVDGVSMDDADMNGEDSDDSLSEMDPLVLQQQLSMNFSMNMVNNDEKVRYSCSLCPYKCNALRSFKCHIHMHGLNKKYICDHCNWSADRLNLLYQHRKVHNGEASFNSNPEDIVFLNREFALENEVSQADKVQDFSTSMYKSDDKLQMEDKMVDMRRMPNRNFAGKKIYTCKLCPFSCNNKNSNVYHKNLHRIKARYTCSECSYSVDRWNLLSQHAKLHKTMENNDPKPYTKRLKCAKCPYTTPSKQLLHLHSSMHGAGKKYTCEFCDYSLDRYNLLQQHMRVHLTEEDGRLSNEEDNGDSLKNYEPSSPDGTPQLYFSSPDERNESDENEDIPNELKCDRCPYSTPSKYELNAHEAQHNVHYKLTCPFCDYGCCEEEQLLDHIQVHFPSTKIDLDMLKSILEKQGKRGGDKSQEIPDISAVKSVTKKLEIEQNGEPDSTTATDQQKNEMSQNIIKEDTKREKTRTKVYVCQYCEREFEGKHLMLQHERQHLIGTKY